MSCSLHTKLIYSCQWQIPLCGSRSTPACVVLTIHSDTQFQNKTSHLCHSMITCSIIPTTLRLRCSSSSSSTQSIINGSKWNQVTLSNELRTDQCAVTAQSEPPCITIIILATSQSCTDSQSHVKKEAPDIKVNSDVVCVCVCWELLFPIVLCCCLGNRVCG